MIRVPIPARRLPFAVLFVCALAATRSIAAPNAADGAWQEFNLLQISVSHAFFDEPRDRVLALGTTPRLGDWALSLGGQRAWEQLPAPSEDYFFQRSTVDASTGVVYYLAFVGTA